MGEGIDRVKWILHLWGALPFMQTNFLALHHNPVRWTYCCYISCWVDIQALKQLQSAQGEFPMVISQWNCCSRDPFNRQFQTPPTSQTQGGSGSFRCWKQGGERTEDITNSGVWLTLELPDEWGLWPNTWNAFNTKSVKNGSCPKVPGKYVSYSRLRRLLIKHLMLAGKWHVFN
jgi:hypothetical protein